MTKHLYENDVPGYARGLDSTLAGSRNGFSALVLWDYLAKHGYEDQREKAIDLIKRARDAERKLTDLEKTLQEDGEIDSLEIALSPRSLAVRIGDEIDSSSCLSFGPSSALRKRTNTMSNVLSRALKTNQISSPYGEFISSPILRFAEPNDKVIEKYSLSVDDGIAYFFCDGAGGR